MPPLWAALALLVGLGAPGHGLVPAPEKVMVQCSDHRPRVSWTHDPHDPHDPHSPTLFTVELRVNGKSFVNQTHDHEFDLSDFVWSSEEQMFEYMFVQITATRGPNQSAKSRPISFSYKLHKVVDVKCHLTFPPVSLVSDGVGATLTVENPLHFYKELKLIQRSAEFELSISIKNRDEVRDKCEEKDCKHYLDFPDDWDSCVNLTGLIIKGNEKIEVRHTGPVCATAPSAAALWLVAVLSVVVLVVVIVSLATAICKVKAWVFPKTPTPQALVPNPSNQKVLFPSAETVYSSVHISGSKPGPKLHDPESPESEDVQTEHQVLIRTEDVRKDSAWYRDYQDESGESTKTETVSINSLDSDEIPATNYERRTHNVNMDLDGDVVEGYMG
ncbi:interferon gamma receptor 1-like isoform X2 [Boleophthalmus pectinirostris]|uniref:interferon gamma receptor 1-like isoform X2 n=1 Tax=Boleophthalmus pectinirostris TaxID=150288 RepID=UPI00242BB5E2|nr:interferon gamma receptor 1-like isoform X2 [Boleophthalmus pectinirostris]